MPGARPGRAGARRGPAPASACRCCSRSPSGWADAARAPARPAPRARPPTPRSGTPRRCPAGWRCATPGAAPSPGSPSLVPHRAAVPAPDRSAPHRPAPGRSADRPPPRRRRRTTAASPRRTPGRADCAAAPPPRPTRPGSGPAPPLPARLARPLHAAADGWSPWRYLPGLPGRPLTLLCLDAMSVIAAVPHRGRLRNVRSERRYRPGSDRIEGGVPLGRSEEGDPRGTADPSSPDARERRDSGSPALSRVGKGGVEPPRPLGHTDLNRARLPFRHLPWRERTLAAAERAPDPTPGRPPSGAALRLRTVPLVDSARDAGPEDTIRGRPALPDRSGDTPPVTISAQVQWEVSRTQGSDCGCAEALRATAGGQ